jgi:hypothetical protein
LGSAVRLLFGLKLKFCNDLTFSRFSNFSIKMSLQTATTEAKPSQPKDEELSGVGEKNPGNAVIEESWWQFLSQVFVPLMIVGFGAIGAGAFFDIVEVS